MPEADALPLRCSIRHRDGRVFVNPEHTTTDDRLHRRGCAFQFSVLSACTRFCIVGFGEGQELQWLALETCSRTDWGTTPGAVPAMIGLAGTVTTSG